MDIVNSPISTIIFILTIGISLNAIYRSPQTFDKFLLHPYSVIRQNRWYNLISSGFIHADLFHLMFNMMTFYFFAFKLEQMAGSFNFAIIYFASLVIADVPSLIKNKDNPDYHSLGASGAISGVLFASILFVPESKIYLMILPVGIPAPIFAVLYLIWCWYAARNAQDNINHSAHLFGALAGIIITVILLPGIVEFFLTNIQNII
jgi:membrane associated rhomboid family serine protease